MLSQTTFDRAYVDAARAAFAERVRAFDVLPEDTRGLDGPEDNPLDEVQIRSASIMSNDSRLTSDQPITSIEFSRLSKAFFDELERRST